MPVTVEARAICANERLADVYVTTAHLHDEPDDLAGFMSRLFDLPHAAVITPSDLRIALERIGYTPRRWWGDDVAPGDPSALGVVVDRFIMMLAIGALDPLAIPPLMRGWPPHPGFFEEALYRRRSDVEAMGPIKATMALDIAARLSSPEGPVDNVLGEALSHLLEHEVPFSASPKLRDGMPLRQLKELARSPKSLVLLPLAGGSLTAAVDVTRGADWSLALTAAGTAFGASLILVSGLWVVDRVYGALKHLDAAQPRRQREIPRSTEASPAPKASRRGRKDGSE